MLRHLLKQLTLNSIFLPVKGLNLQTFTRWKRAYTIGPDQDYDLLVFRSCRKGGHHDQVECWSFFRGIFFCWDIFRSATENALANPSPYFCLPLKQRSWSSIAVAVPCGAGGEHLFANRSCATEHLFV